MTEANTQEFNELLELINKTMEGITATDVAMRNQMDTLNWLFLRVSQYAPVPGMQRIIQLCTMLVGEPHSNAEYMALMQELDAALARTEQGHNKLN